MPKVTISDSKGIVQESGSGLTVQGSTDFQSDCHFQGNQVHGHRTRVSEITLQDYGVAGYHSLSGSDSGRTFILGDVGSATRTVFLPNASAGWTATFVTTGSITNSGRVILTGSANTKDQAPFCGSVIGADNGQTSNSTTVADVAGNAGAAVAFNIGNGAAAGDVVTVVCVKDGTGSNKFVVDGKVAV